MDNEPEKLLPASKGNKWRKRQREREREREKGKKVSEQENQGTV